MWVRQVLRDARTSSLSQSLASRRAIISKNVPLKQFKPELGRINFNVEGGTLASDGFVEYGPKAEKVEVYEAKDRRRAIRVYACDTDSRRGGPPCRRR